MNLNPEPLFNKTVIEKLCSKIKLTDLQKQSALTWIKKIENNELANEQTRQNLYEKFILIQILGYDLEELPRENLEIDYTMEIPGFQKSMCMEVKGTSTKDLFKDQKRKDDSKLNPVIQLYTYMSHGFDYGVVSNYKDFILLTKNTQLVKAHKFDFLSIKKTEDRIDENKLKEFILLFSKKEVFVNNSIEELSNQTILSEQEFTDEFYKLFHETRLMLIKEFEESSNIPHDVAIYYSQIFLNRLIFIYFVEDHNFIPSSLFEKRILGILQSPSIDESTHLIFDDIVGLFKIMNIGSKVHGVNGFNGGLFGDDVIPSNITFSDLRDADFFTECYKNSNLKIKATAVDISISGIYAEKLSPLIKNLLIMASHDFTSDLDVNILGRIFEQSISDIELLKENEISKRKKDGVFYTPDYITDYISRNTIIPYLSKTQKNSIIDLVDEYSENLEDLETKLKNLKILDPACGSGAFLVKAVDILLKIDEEIQLRKPAQTVSQTGMDEFTKVKDINLIIENNIYGVDINPESVEITKLSLFLKLAGPQTKLSYLSNNIKIGNSLISDTKISNSSFSWSDEFPEIFGSLIDDKGFDIVLGNPPYVRQEIIKNMSTYFKKTFQSFSGKADLYVYFIEQSTHLLKSKGVLGMITSGKFTEASYGKPLQKFMIDNLIFKKIINFKDLEVFPGVTAYPLIFLAKKESNSNYDFPYYDIDVLDFENLEEKITGIPSTLINIEDLIEYDFNFLSKESVDIMKTISKDSISLEDFCPLPLVGTKTGFKEGYLTDLEKSDFIKPYIFGKDIKKYGYVESSNNIIFPYLFGNSKYSLIDLKNHKNLLKELEKNKETLEKRAIIKEGIKQNTKKWYEFQQINKTLNFNNEYIVYPNVSLGPNFTISSGNIIDMTGFVIPTNDRLILGILNSKLIDFLMKQWAIGRRGGYQEYRVQYIEKIPIPKISENMATSITEYVNKILILSKEIHIIKKNFIDDLQILIEAKIISKKILNFEKLSFVDFMIEVNRLSKKRIFKDKQNILRDDFEYVRKSILEKKDIIKNLENNIDIIIFASYGLSKSQIDYIENYLI